MLHELTISRRIWLPSFRQETRNCHHFPTPMGQNIKPDHRFGAFYPHVAFFGNKGRAARLSSCGMGQNDHEILGPSRATEDPQLSKVILFEGRRQISPDRKENGPSINTCSAPRSKQHTSYWLLSNAELQSVAAVRLDIGKNAYAKVGISVAQDHAASCGLGFAAFLNFAVGMLGCGRSAQQHIYKA